MTDRQARDLPLDAHVHTNLSPDSNVAIDDYAASALERGIAEIAITDHVDFEPGAPAFAFTTFEDRERIVRGAAERWGPQGVQIRFGVELTYDRSWEGDIRDHLARYAYDFTIGSVHDRVDSPYSPSRVAVVGRGQAAGRGRRRSRSTRSWRLPGPGCSMRSVTSMASSATSSRT